MDLSSASNNPHTCPPPGVQGRPGERGPAISHVGNATRDRYIELAPRKISLQTSADRLLNAFFNVGQPLHNTITMQCGSNCLCCSLLHVSNTIDSITMNRSYFPITAENIQMNCLTRSIIYVVTCKKCELQYVGQTRL
jgi:hypothetical protein